MADDRGRTEAAPEVLGFGSVGCIGKDGKESLVDKPWQTTCKVIDQCDLQGVLP